MSVDKDFYNSKRMYTRVMLVIRSEEKRMNERYRKSVKMLSLTQGNTKADTEIHSENLWDIVYRPQEERFENLRIKIKKIINES